MNNNKQTEDRAFRPPQDRSSAQLERLRHLLQKVKSTDNFYGKTLANIDSSAVMSIQDLYKLPFVSKDEFVALQKISPPFGGLMNNDATKADYLFLSPGPIFEPGFMYDKYWRSSRAMRAAGITSDDILHNTYSYHLTPGAWMMEAGAHAIGCAVIPAGTASLDTQVEAINHYKPTAFSGTPDFLKRLVQFYLEICGEAPPFTKALVSGSALTPGLREYFDSSCIDVKECYATAEAGLIAYETNAREGMVVDEDIIVEIIDPKTGEPAPFGEQGEIVVTLLREDYPLFRFCTGDVSAFLGGASPCGRTGPRIIGWKGRADQSTKVRGMFVRPVQIKTLLQRNPIIEKARLIVHRDNERDEMILHCELRNNAPQTDVEKIQDDIALSFRAICHLGSKVSVVPAGTIPDDGKIIVDLRKV